MGAVDKRQSLCFDILPEGEVTATNIHGRGVMKRFLFISLILSLLAGCSGLPFSIPFLQTPTPVSSQKPTATPFSLEATNTPNLFVINTAEATVTGTLPSGTPLETNTSLPSATPTWRPTITLEPIDPSL